MKGRWEMMFRFKKEMKKALLKGRKVKYIENNEVIVNEFYLSEVLNGKKCCSRRLATLITRCGDMQSVIEDYFVEEK